MRQLVCIESSGESIELPKRSAILRIGQTVTISGEKYVAKSYGKIGKNYRHIQVERKDHS